MRFEGGARRELRPVSRKDRTRRQREVEQLLDRHYYSPTSPESAVGCEGGNW